MYIFGNTKDIIAGLNFFYLFGFVGCHLLGKVTILSIFHFDLAFIIEHFYLLLTDLTLMIGMGRLFLTALMLLNPLELFLLDETCTDPGYKCLILDHN